MMPSVFGVRLKHPPSDHLPAQMKIDSFQARRSSDGNYKTMKLAGALFGRVVYSCAPKTKPGSITMAASIS